MRVTLHNARFGKDGVFSPRHNDRNFNIENAEHIDQERTSNNRYWNCYNRSDMTFEEVEREFYEEHFTAHLNAQNQRYMASRHYKRTKTLDEYRTSRQTCPEETILMIGNKNSYVPPKTLWSICEEFKDWEQKTVPGLHVLNMSLHDDEASVHVHIRQVFLYKDKEGNEAVGQNKALEESGCIPLPYPDRPRSKYNNRKQTYSRMAREEFFNICRRHGLDTLLETQPREKSKSGRDLVEYQAEQAEERARSATALVKNQYLQTTRLRDEEKKLSARLQRKRDAYLQAENELDALEREIQEIQGFLHTAEQRKAFEIFNREHERTR